MKKDKMKLAGLLLAIACTSALGAGAVVASGTATGNNVVVQAEETSEYTTHTLGRLVMHANGGNAKSVYLKKAAGGALPFEAWENPWVLESGDGLKVNGTKVSMGEMQSAKEGLYIRFDAVAEGDILTISGTFRCDKQKLKYVIEESSFKWNGTKWENATDYADTATGKISVVEKDSTASAVYLLTTADLPVKDWESPCTYVSGNGITLNGTMISFNNSVKSVDVHTIYISLGTTAVEGDVLKVGGTIRNDKHGADIVLEDTEFVYNGTTWVLVEKDEPEVVYTEYQISTLIPNNNSNGTNAAATAATALYMMREDGQAMPIVDGTWSAIFTLESGDGWKLNGNSVTVGNFVSADAGLYIDLNAAKVQPGDVLSVSGTFVYEGAKTKYVLSESKFIWTGSVWTKYTVAPTTYEIGKLAIDGGSSATAINFKKASGVGFEAVDGEWKEKLYFISGTGVGVTLNGTALKVNDCKIPGNIYLSLEGKTAVEGDELVIGGTFFNGNLAVKYVVEESTFVFDGTNWVEKVVEPEVPAIQYTSYNVTKVGATRDSNASALYLYALEGDNLPKSDPADWSSVYTAETGATVTLNGTEVPGGDIKLPGDLYLPLGTTAVAGDVMTINGTFYNEAKAIKLVFNNCKLEFNGEKWVEYVAYTTHELGQLSFKDLNGGNAKFPQFVSATGVEIPSDADWVAYTCAAGNGATLNGAKVAAVKFPSCVFVELSAAPAAGDKLVVGGTFVNQAKAQKYVITETTFWWNGEAWQTEEYQAPAPEYNVVEVGTIAPYANTNAARVYFQPADTSVTWCTGSENFLYESGSAFTIIRNGETVVTINNHIASRLNNGAKNAYVMLPDGFALQAGDKVVFGGTFYNEAYLMKYVFTDTEMWWNGTAWQLEEYVAPNPEAYTEVNLGKLTLASQSSTADNAHNQRIYTHTSDGALVAVEGVKDYTTTYVSGTQVLLNGEACAYSRSNVVENAHYYYFKLAVGGQEVGANVGDKVTIGGVFVSEEHKIKYTIEDTDFWWNGTTWQTEEYKAPEIEEPEAQYTIVTLGKAKLTGQSISAPATNRLYLASADDIRFADELKAKNFVFESGTGFVLDGVVISDAYTEYLRVSDNKIFRFYTDKVAIKAGSSIKVGGTFVNEDLKVKIVLEDSEFWWTGGVWQAEPYVAPTEPVVYEMGVLGVHANSDGTKTSHSTTCIYMKSATTLPFKNWDAKFVLVEGDGWKVNGNPVTLGNLVSTGEGLYINLANANIQTGDVLSVSGTFYYETGMAKYVVQESKFVWNGTAWEDYVENYATYEVGSLIFSSWTANNQIYVLRADGQKFEVPADGNNGWTAVFLPKAGVGVTLNGTAIAAGKVKFPNSMFIDVGAAPAVGDILTIGGTFYNTSLAMQFVVTETSFMWDGTTWVLQGVDEPEVEYTTHNIGKVAMHNNGGKANHVYLKCADGSALPFQAWENPWVVDGSNGLMVNGTAVSIIEMQSAPDGLYVKFDAIQAGDYITVGGTFRCDTQNLKYVIEESSFLWTGSVWVPYTVAPTTYEIGKVAIDNDSTATAINFKKANGEAFEAKDGTWAEKLYFIAGTGVGVTINGTQIDMSDIKIPNNMYVGLKTTAVAGDKLVIGGTFFNGVLAVKYVVEESTFVFDGTNWVAEVEEEPEVPDVPAIQYTTYTATKVGATSSSNTTQLFLYALEGDAFPKSDPADWGSVYTFEAGSGAGLKLNDTALTTTDIKLPGDFFIALGVTAVAGDIVTIDGTYYNEAKAIKIVFVNCQVQFDGEKWGEVKQDEPEDPAPAATVYEIGILAVHRNSDNTNPDNKPKATQLYMKRADGQALPFAPATWNTKFAFESGDGWKINGNPVTFGSLVSTNAGLFVDVSAANAQPGDVLSVSGTFYCETENAKYVIEESKFVWNGTAWEAYVENYATYEVGSLIFSSWTAGSNFIYLSRADGQAFEIPADGNGGWDAVFLPKAGVGVTLNGTAIKAGSMKFPNVMFINIYAAPNVGDVLTIGGTFYNTSLAMQYVVTETSFKWDGTTWVLEGSATPDVPDVPDVQYTTYTATKVGSTSSSNTTQLFLYAIEGDEFPKSDPADWDSVYTFETGSGVGLKLNNTALTTTDIKLPGDFFIALGATAVAGDIVTIDGAYYNEEKAIKIVFENCQVQFDGEKWVVYEGSDTPVDPSGWTTVELGAVKVHKHSMEGGAGVGANKLYFTSSAAVEYPINSWKSRFILESGDGWKLNGNAITVKEFISADKHLYITLAQAAEVGDILTVSGTFSYADGKVQYVIEESTFIWNGTYWENYVEYTEYELGTLKFRMWTAGSNHIYLYGADDPRDGSIPKPNDGNSGWTATFKWKDGIGIQINGQNVSASVKYPGEIFIAFSKAPAVGDILTVGGTFYNDDLAIAYIVGETSFTWDGTTWIEVVDYTDYEVDALTTLGAQTLAGSIDVKKADNGTFETNGTFKFLGGSGIGIAINGEAIETKQIAILGNMMTFSINPKANEGDVLTIGGTFYNVETATRYIIEESSFIYENGAWSVYESNYNEIGLGEVIVLADASDAQYIYLASKDDTLELPVNSWEAEFIPTFGLGVTLNGQVVEDVVILSVDNSIYLELPSEAQDGDILVIGGKFVCEAEGALYFVKNSQFTWNADEAAWEGVINYNTMEVGKLKLFGNSATETAGKSDRIHFKASSALVLEDFTLALESGIGFTVNGEQREFTLKNVKDGSGYLYFTFDSVEEGDVVTIGGTFYNKEMAVKYVIEESTFIWENGAWSIIYEKVNVGPVVIITTSTSRQDLYLAPANGKTFTASGWEDPLYYVSGTGITVDGVEINMNNTVKVPDIGTIFVRLTSTADGVAEGAVVVIGGVFRCPTSGVEYTIEESTFVYANGAWSNQLDTVKSETVAALDEYFATFTEGDYYETEWALMTEIVATTKAAINAEISKFAVETLFANAKAEMDAVATKADWDAESDQIKAQAKADIESYKNANEYRDADKAVIATTVAQALADIDAATDWATMNTVVKNAKAALDALWTAAEWDAAEAVVAAAKAELESYKSEADYFVEEWTTIQIIIASASANIDVLIGNTASIENVVKEAKAKMDAVKTMEQVIADEAVVNAAKDELAGYKAQADYNEPEWNEIQTIIAKAYANIDEAIGDEATIANIVADAKAKMDKVLKSEEANKKAFDDAKATAEAAIRELANSINYDEYSEEAANEISGYLAAAVEAIEAVTEKEDFAKIVEDVTAKIASVEKLAVADDNGSIIDKVKEMAGCGSVVGLTTGVTLMAAAAAIVLNKKKED